MQEMMLSINLSCNSNNVDLRMDISATNYQEKLSSETNDTEYCVTPTPEDAKISVQLLKEIHADCVKSLMTTDLEKNDLKFCSRNRRKQPNPSKSVTIKNYNGSFGSKHGDINNVEYNPLRINKNENESVNYGEDETIMCQICGTVETTISQLQQHITEKHLTNNKEYNNHVLHDDKEFDFSTKYHRLGHQFRDEIEKSSYHNRLQEVLQEIEKCGKDSKDNKSTLFGQHSPNAASPADDEYSGLNKQNSSQSLSKYFDENDYAKFNGSDRNEFCIQNEEEAINLCTTVNNPVGSVNKIPSNNTTDQTNIKSNIFFKEENESSGSENDAMARCKSDSILVDTRGESEDGITHSEKGDSCNICFKQFANKYYLRKHKLDFHGSLADNATVLQSDIKNDSGNGPKSLVSTVASNISTYKDAITTHLEVSGKSSDSTSTMAQDYTNSLNPSLLLKSFDLPSYLSGFQTNEENKNNLKDFKFPFFSNDILSQKQNTNDSSSFKFPTGTGTETSKDFFNLIPGFNGQNAMAQLLLNSWLGGEKEMQNSSFNSFPNLLDPLLLQNSFADKTQLSLLKSQIGLKPENQSGIKEIDNLPLTFNPFFSPDFGSLFSAQIPPSITPNGVSNMLGSVLNKKVNGMSVEFDEPGACDSKFYPLDQTGRRKHEEGIVSCDVCGKEFCNSYFVKIHKRDKHDIPLPKHSDSQISISENTDGTKIPNSDAGFSDAKEFDPKKTKKESSNSSDIGCIDAENILLGQNKNSSLKVEMEKCSECDQTFTNRYSLLVHLISVHDIKPSGYGLASELLQVDQLSRLSGIQGETSNNTNRDLLARLQMFPNFSKMNFSESMGQQNTVNNSEGDQAGRIAERVICNICNKELCNKYFLKTHRMKVHGLDEDDGMTGFKQGFSGVEGNVLRDFGSVLTSENQLSSMKNQLKEEYSSQSFPYKNSHNFSSDLPNYRADFKSSTDEDKEKSQRRRRRRTSSRGGSPGRKRGRLSSSSINSRIGPDSKFIGESEGNNFQNKIPHSNETIKQISELKEAFSSLRNLPSTSGASQIKIKDMISDMKTSNNFLPIPAIGMENFVNPLLNIFGNGSMNFDPNLLNLSGAKDFDKNDSSTSSSNLANVFNNLSGDLSGIPSLKYWESLAKQENLISSFPDFIKSNLSAVSRTGSGDELPISSSASREGYSRPTAADLIKSGIDPEAYCEICQKEFCSKYFLKTHRQKIHGFKVDQGWTNNQQTDWLKNSNLHELNQILSIRTNFPSFLSGMPGNIPENNIQTSIQNGSSLAFSNFLNDAKSTEFLFNYPTSSFLSMKDSGLSGDVIRKSFDNQIDSNNIRSSEDDDFVTSAGKSFSKFSIPATQANRVLCKICGKELCNKYFLKTHMAKVHQISRNENEPDHQIRDLIANDSKTAATSATGHQKTNCTFIPSLLDEIGKATENKITGPQDLESTEEVVNLRSDDNVCKDTQPFISGTDAGGKKVLAAEEKETGFTPNKSEFYPALDVEQTTESGCISERNETS